MTITEERARAFLVQYHLLNARVGMDEFLQTIPARLGSIQYDPLDIVCRNHELVFQSRVANIVRADVHDAIYRDRRLVDAWDKMMGLVAPEDWIRLAHVRAFKDADTRKVLTNRRQLDALAHTDLVLAHITERGPSDASDIDLGSSAPGSWGLRKNAGVVCDYLFNIGRLGIRNRVGTRKVYDLIERIIPESLLSPVDAFRAEREFDKWMILRRVSAIGLLWNRNGVLWQGFSATLTGSGYRAELFAELVKEGRLDTVLVQGIDRPFYAIPESLDLVRAAPLDGFDGELRFLAPLDNLLWDRELVEALFHFSYSWEVYLPAQKRKFGYYVIPMLLDSRIVGRIEPVLDRKNCRLSVKNTWFEDGQKARCEDVVARGLASLRDFLGAEA